MVSLSPEARKRYAAQIAAKTATTASTRRRAATKRAKVGDGMSDLEASLLGQIRMAGLEVPLTQYRFAAPRRQWRADFCWVDAKVIAEVDGATFAEGRHTRGLGYEGDCEKQNAAVEMGYRYVRFTKHMVNDGRALATLHAVLR